MNSTRMVALGTCLVSLSPLESVAWAQTPPLATEEAAPPAPAVTQPAPPPPVVPPPVVTTTSPTVDITTLRVLRDRGTITPLEYAAAMRDIAPTTGEKVGGDSPSLVIGKWSTTLYGFAEADFIHDSTQSFNDLAGSALVQRASLTPPEASAMGLTPPASGPNLQTYAGNHGRTQFSVRNSRLGFLVRAPEFSKVRVSGTLETDFLGYVPPPSYTTGQPTEATFFTSPSLRLRVAVLRMETPVVDLLIGQYWDVFGWQGVYQPNSVEIQGLPGELYSRTPQIRVSKTLANDSVSFEVAAAAMRPPSRNSQIPEAQGGIRFSLPFWKGVTTNAATATSVMPFSIAVTGDYRHFDVPEMKVIPVNSIGLDTEAAAVDVFIPVIPAKHVEDGNALSITAEAVTGSGMADLYQSLTGGITFPVLTNTLAINPPPVYPQDIDNGLVNFCPIAAGSPAACPGNPGSLVGIKWQTVMVGAQYYLPWVGGRVWVSGNFSYQTSPNSADFARPVIAANPLANNYGSTIHQVRQSELFADANLFVQVVPAARIGAEYAVFNDQYVDGQRAVNNRFQISTWFIF